ncbi:hypothetical protein [Paraburkholderia sp. A3RO-2L]|jgi:hypothetical protein|uniref:hypothetical protein n=1 Tax=unclassified Paraburkholderia TaxID=2615204 RepID=UPI003DA852BB
MAEIHSDAPVPSRTHDVDTRAPASPDKGPWMVNKWSGERVVLQSDDFTHDVALVVDGDFGSHEEKLAYANALAAWMNANLPAPTRAAANN